jgi:predicted metal-binding protein
MGDNPMFPPLEDRTNLIVCSTCRFSKDAREDANGRRGGALFAEALAAALVEHRCRDRVELQEMPCLFACTSHCTAYIRAERRLGYVLGRFVPSREHAVALLDYISEYLDTSDGVVPYANWPDGVKGHFLVRVPPRGFVWAQSR